MPTNSGKNDFSASFITRWTPLPSKLSPSSLFSTASFDPVDAPEGTKPNSSISFSKIILAATVGVPLESKIS